MAIMTLRTRRPRRRQTWTALSLLQAQGNRHQAARARQDTRDRQVKRRERTRKLIELGGLVVKAGIVELTDDDRATIYGALLWMAAKLTSEDGSHARALWQRKGRRAFELEAGGDDGIDAIAGR